MSSEPEGPAQTPAFLSGQTAIGETSLCQEGLVGVVFGRLANRWSHLGKDQAGSWPGLAIPAQKAARHEQHEHATAALQKKR